MRIVFEFIIKIIKRIKSLLKYATWKLAYCKGLNVGKNVFFYPGCRLIVEHTGKVLIGNNCFFNHGCSISSLGKITIGNDCIFGEDVKIYDHNHIFKSFKVPFKKQGYNISEVYIGNNVWIGSNTIILPNIIIGNNVVIGAGSIVSKSIPDNTIFIQKRSI